ncbi:hypothetical protein AYK26_02615 [Euryarchaeota archaeon SM23-78]|nr:MAG: hypothetical protein AYK26_02615 [Euryarchaeota archaeon SM23-78]MBW3000264.1 ABC transporter permease [Candidatus Woesearchaeota archaeon]
MKLISIIKKNFKLLLRAKASAFTVLVGPLLIVLLVGLAFSGKTSYELSIGYYAPTYNNLTDDFIEGLEQSYYYIQEFKNEQSCVKKIEEGIIHTCIIFPKDFEIRNEQRNELRFLVDYSRMNLVYKVIESVSDILEIESKELSYSLTQVLLSKINITVHDLDEDIVFVSDLNPRLNLLMADLQKANTNTEAMRFDLEEVSVASLNTRFSALNKTITEIQNKGLELINESMDYIEIIKDDAGWDENETAELEEDFNELKNETLELYNATPEKIQSVVSAITKLSSSLDELESDLNKSKQLKEDTMEKLASAKDNLSSLQTSLSDLKNALEKSRNNLKSISITRAETIVSPVNTKIEPVISETSKLTFTFPFLLVLVIMFVALLLSSTIIIFEKNSKAFFRSFITPTRPEFFVLTTFLTSFIVIILQTIIILGLANYYLQVPLFKNALSTVLVLLATTTFFIVLGMAVGYLFSTQEGAIMTSIVLGAVFMFLSNLVVPLESLAPAFSKIIKYNPYVISSELLRKSLLFKIETSETWMLILILLGAALIILLLILLFQGVMRKKRIRQPLDMLENMLLHPEKAAAKIPTKEGVSRAGNLKLLLKKVSDMTQAEFEENVNLRQNKVTEWAKSMGKKKLASKIKRTLSKNEIMKLLVEEIKKEEKKERKTKKKHED